MIKTSLVTFLHFTETGGTSSQKAQSTTATKTKLPTQNAKYMEHSGLCPGEVILVHDPKKPKPV